MAGVTCLPKATGETAFDFGTEIETPMTEAPQPESSAVKASTTTKTPVKPTVETEISEVKVGYRLDSHGNGAYQSSPLEFTERVEQLTVLQGEVAACTMCTELAGRRKNTVFGVGNPAAELCFLGEGPGADEDRIGEPFVGQAGQLLNKIIAACKMAREDVYILNTVKCRPPGNRNPNESELENCWPFAIRQLEILQPKFICCLGSVAAKTLLKSKQSIGRMRGQFFPYRGSQVMVTYHPAYLLRNPTAKKQVWEDMKMLMSQMGREI